MARWTRLFGALLAALALAAPVSAYRRLVEKDLRLQRPAFALIAGLGGYDPAGGTGANGGLMLSTGLRYIRPDFDDDSWHSIGFELGASTWSSSTADVMLLTGEVLLFWPRTQVLTFDHHFFVGAGVGQAQIDNSRRGDESPAAGLIEGGLQGRVRDWYMELRLKFIFGSRRALFDLEGLAPTLAASYHFDI